MPEAEAVEVPEDLDPAQVVSLVLTYMTAYQLLHRMAMVKRGEAVLVHGAAGRVGTAVEQRCKAAACPHQPRAGTRRDPSGGGHVDN